MRNRQWMIGIFGLLLITLLVSLACGLPFVGGDEDDDSSSINEEAPAAEVEQPPVNSEEKPPMPEDGEPDQPPKPPAGEGDQPPPKPPGAGEFDTDFPLPPNVQNFIDLGDDAITFQTSMPFDKAAEFYLDTLQEQGLIERKLLTVIEDGVFSMVFDGAPNGKAVVVQGVDLGETTNISIRYEDV